MNKWGNLSRARNDRWLQELSKFRTLFEDVDVNGDDITAHLTNLCEQIKWTGLPFLLPPEEWLLLQCVCGQARRELMESVYLYSAKTAGDQA